MGDEHDGSSLPVQALEDRDDLLCALRVEAGRRLVKHDHLGRHRQHPRDRDPPLLPAAQCEGGSLSEAIGIELNGRQRPAHALLDPFLRPAEVARPERDVGGHGLLEELKLRKLEDQSHLLADALEIRPLVP